MNAIPYVSRVDAGTIEQIRSLGVEIVSSADLISMYNALWTKEQFQKNKPVAYALNEIVYKSFDFIKKKISNSKSTTEYEVQQFIMNEFKRENYLRMIPQLLV